MTAAACFLTVTGLGAGMAMASLSQTAALRFQVTTTADAHDAHLGDGHCADAAGQCTLRAAIEEADASPENSAVTISVPAGSYRLPLGPLTVGAATAEPETITIDGAGPGHTVISGDHKFQVMMVTSSVTAVLDAVQITNGHTGPDGYGGGVFSSGRLTIAGSTIDDNVAGGGGGVDNAGGTLVVTGSTIKNNNGDGWGGGGIQNGGPRNLPGSVLVVSSTITGNTTFANNGGGIFSGQNGHPPLPGEAAVRPRLCPDDRCTGPLPPPSPGLVLTVENSDVSGNRADGGGGIVADGRSSVTGSTIDDNSAGIAPWGGLLDVASISDSTIDGNTGETDAALGDRYLSNWHMSITDSTIEGNHAASYGGVMTVGSDDFITGTTIADNTAGSKAQPGVGAFAMIQGGGVLHLTNSTVTGNTTTPAGGGAIDNSGFGGVAYLKFDTLQNNVAGNITGTYPVTVTATILATNGTEPNCQAPLFRSGGFNLATDRSCGLLKSTDLTGVNPKLGPLASNGGPTSTEALLTGSPAINAGGLPATSGCPLTDQRGQSRPWGPACDIGAYEAHYPLPDNRRHQLPA